MARCIHIPSFGSTKNLYNSLKSNTIHYGFYFVVPQCFPLFMTESYLSELCSRYGQMERVTLSAEISAIDLRGAVTRGIGSQGIELSETIRRMEESVPQVIVLLEASVDRCISFTGGSEADELILALDDVMLQFISTLQEILKTLRIVCGVDVAPDGVGSKKETGSEKRDGPRKFDLSSEDEWSYVQSALQILTVADCLSSRSAVFEASLRATLARLNTNLSSAVFGSSIDPNSSHETVDGNGDLSMAGRAALDVAALRLFDAPEKARKLFNLLEQVIVYFYYCC